MKTKQLLIKVSDGPEEGDVCTDVCRQLWHLNEERRYRVVFTDAKPRGMAHVYQFAFDGSNHITLPDARRGLQGPWWILWSTAIRFQAKWSTREVQGFCWCEEL